MLFIVAMGIGPSAALALVNTYWVYISWEAFQAFQAFQFTINLIVFSIGTAIPLFYARSLFRALSLSRRKNKKAIEFHQVAVERCVALSRFISWLCFFLWFCTGLVYPFLITNYAGKPITRIEFSEFLAAQIVHGTIAASLTYLTITLATMRAALPQLVRMAPIPDARPQLSRIRRTVDRHLAVLGMAPSCALVLFTLLRWQGRAVPDVSLFLTLGIFGASSFGVGLLIMPVSTSSQ
jgi:hypothetical protein